MPQGCLAESHVSALQVLVALSAYRVQHGAPPDTLDVLVPEWLERVPVDAFDGKPIRYSAENAVVYSVGKDFFDGGGNGDPAQGFRRVTREPTLAISF